MGAAGEGVPGEEGEGQCRHRGAALAVSRNYPSSCSLRQVVELLRDKRKQNTCREGAEEVERKLLLYCRVWSPSFAAQESDKPVGK